MTDSSVTPSGLWDVPTTAPSLAELEFQLRQLSPLRALGAAAASKSRLGGGGGGGGSSKSPALKSGRGGARAGIRHSGAGIRHSSGGAARVAVGGARSRSSDERRRARPERGGGGGGGGSGEVLTGRGLAGHQRSLSREGIARGEPGEGFGRGVSGGGGRQGEEEQGLADLSSVVLVSSLSSTPGRRRSGSGRWAAGRGGQGRGQARQAGPTMGRVDLGVDDLSAAHWELAEAERGLEVRKGELF
ncbi:unnamed protein product [Hapterophycus canaliculatus]